MLPEKRTNTNVGVGMGFLLQLAGFFLAQTGDTAAILALVLILISIPVFIWGCMNYAEGKGHSKWVGLVGLAGIIGLIVLIVLPDQDLHGPGARAPLGKIVGLISMTSGFGVAVIGLWLDRAGLEDLRLGRQLEPWPGVCMILGASLVVGSLVLIVMNPARKLDEAAGNEQSEPVREAGPEEE
jgi:drug/metabolite transporter (DMT)-like permease